MAFYLIRDCGVVLVLLIVIRWVHGLLTSFSRVCPPGPPKLPFIGNAFHVPFDSAWKVYRKWSRQCGSDIIQLTLPLTNIVALNSLQVAVDLLDKKSSIYSDRPYSTMKNKLIGLEWALGSMRYGQKWRDTRKAFHQAFNSETIKNYRQVHENASRDLLRDLLHRPSDFPELIRLMTGKIILKVTYGIDIHSESDPYLRIAEQGTQAISATVSVGVYIVDVFPFLRYLPQWLPGMHFKAQARRWHDALSLMFTKPFEVAKSRMDQGDITLCAARFLLEGKGEAKEDVAYAESIIQSALGSVYLAGVDTTMSTLCTFILTMVLYPEVQEKARDEIIQVVGKERLPTLSDFGNIPYIDAVVNECLRWHPAVPIGGAHRLMEDDEYNGYFLRKGSITVANACAILQEEDAYPEPLRFNPDRYLTEDGRWNPEVRDPVVAAFGFGRRICPGRFMAKEMLWIAMASILTAFKIEKALNECGEDITPEEEYTSGFLSYPKPFKCSIRVRSKEYEALVLDGRGNE